MCCSRATFAIVIGAFNILIYCVAIIISIVYLVQIENAVAKDYRLRNDLSVATTVIIALIVLCCIMAVISGLMVTGVVKNRHKLMLPWMILSAIGFVCNCVKFLIDFFTLVMYSVQVGHILLFVFISLLAIAISFLILRVVFSVYRDIRDENFQRIGRAVNAVQYQRDNNYKL